MKEQNTMEIDVFHLFKILWKRKILVALVAIVAGALAFAYSAFIVKPEFTSTTRIYVVNRNQGDKPGLTNQDLQAGSYLVKDYREIILSQDVLEKVTSNLKLDLSPKDLANKVKVTVPVDTRIVSISVNDRVPEEASRIANSLREVAAEKIISITRVSDVTTLEEARPAIAPSSPNIRRNTIIGLLGGTVFTVIAVLIVELVDTRVKRPEDIEDVMQIALLGVVPNLDKLKWERDMPTLEIAQKKLYLAKKAEEYYNALRTNIQLSGNNLQVISITSVKPGEGKSTTSTNIAWAFARAGYKTLLVDADIRNSVMSGVFKSREKITGLTDFLSGTTDLSHGLCDTNVENLFVVQAGSISPNPTALLQSENFSTMIDTLRKYFDYIIVDTAPIGIVIDAAIITQKCDASVLVTAAGEANRKDVQKAKGQLEQTNKPFLGVVLNKFNTSAEKYGSYGEYGSYGKK